MIKHIYFIAFLLSSCFTHSQNNYNEITLTELLKKAQKDAGKIVILDVRTKGEYNDSLSGTKQLNIGRIKGTINIPLQDLQQKPEAIHQLDNYKDKEIYVICSHSYRSRAISNLLMANGFSNITNVKGGMSEWFRNYRELQPYRQSFYEENIDYTNISPDELFMKLQKQPVELIGFSNSPRSFFDSLIVNLYKYFPDFRDVTYFKSSDSLQVLEKAKASKGKAIVTFSTVGIGGGEAADWLTKKGIPNVSYLVGNLSGFYEYMVNFRNPADVQSMLKSKSKINFYTPLSFCKHTPANFQFVDMRHDTLFNKITNGTKLSYRIIKGSTNFPYYRSADEFEASYPDKSKEYILIPHQGYTGLELVDALISKGYNIGFLPGGIERWEWYTNNVDAFTCKDYLVK